MGTVESASFTGTLNNKSEDGEFLTLDLAGEGTLTVGVNTAISVVDEAKPRSFTLAQNYPNPFNADTIIPFQIPREEVVSLAIYNLQGQLVSRLVNGPLAAGTYRVIWKGVDRSGVPMGSGVYLYRISAGGQQITRRMMLVK
jgi:hypothetical protein